jgi:hypothetical protein
MRNSAVADRPRSRKSVLPRSTHAAPRSNQILLTSVLVVLVAAGIGLFLVFRPGESAPATGSEHSLGEATAPIVVEEWSDFE